MLALAELCIKNKKGIRVKLPKNKNKETEWFFGEDQSRYLVILNNAVELKKFAKKKKVKIEEVALVEDNNFFEIENKFKIPIKKLIKYNNSWYKKFINK